VLRFNAFVDDPVTSQLSIRTAHIVNPESPDAPPNGTLELHARREEQIQAVAFAIDSPHNSVYERS